MLLESLIVGVGTAIAKSVMAMWFQDRTIILAASTSIADVLGKKIPGIRERRAIERQFGQIADRSAESVLKLIENEGAALPEDRLEFVANAASATISSTPINAQLLAEQNLEPGKLAAYFQNKTGAEGVLVQRELEFFPRDVSSSFALFLA